MLRMVLVARMKIPVVANNTVFIPLSAGLVLASCDVQEKCPGTGNCKVIVNIAYRTGGQH